MEKQRVYSIRKLKNGVASVAIATAFFALGTSQVSAEELRSVDGAVVQQTVIPVESDLEETSIGVSLETILDVKPVGELEEDVEDSPEIHGEAGEMTNTEEASELVDPDLEETSVEVSLETVPEVKPVGELKEDVEDSSEIYGEAGEMTNTEEASELMEANVGSEVDEVLVEKDRRTFF